MGLQVKQNPESGAHLDAAVPKKPVWSWTDAVAQADVPPSTKLVCLNIARYLSSAGKGWRISIKEMMDDTGLSNTSLATHLANAERAGLIVIKREVDHHGHRSGTTYTPRFPDGTELAKEPADMGGPSVAPTPGPKPGPSEKSSLRDAARPSEKSSPRDAARPSEKSSRGLSEKSSRQVSFLSQSFPKKKKKPLEQVDGAAKKGFQKTDDVLGEAGKLLIPFDHVIDLKADNGPRYRFSKKTIAQIRMMPCVDLVDVVERCEAWIAKKRAKGEKVHNPDGYLLRMASEVVERREGVSEEHVKAMASKDQVKRAAFLAAEVEPIGPVKAARPSAELVAHLARTRA